MDKISPQIRQIDLHIKGRVFHIEYFIRPGSRETILFIHGLGGAKENFWESCKSSALSDHTLICPDNPGSGNSTYYDDLSLNVDDLAAATAQFVEKLDLKDFILAGTSMGGLITMLYLQNGGAQRTKAYINIEGNFMPEDCMFSSKVVVHDYDNFSKNIFPAVVREMKKRKNAGYHIIANNLEINTHIRSYYDYSFQTVEYSASGELLTQYLKMRIPRLFIYGDENKDLSYIPRLIEKGMKTEMIANSNHFIFYDNPKELYEKIARFVSAL
jgi:pimeloyl-ACP methyl ester carboxylesterase